MASAGSSHRFVKKKMGGGLSNFLYLNNGNTINSNQLRQSLLTGIIF